MKGKSLATGVLLAFVVFSILYLVIKEARISEPKDESRIAESVETLAGGSEDKAANTHVVIAYYFHGNVRCVTCKKIEKYTTESITSKFTNELSTGELQWKVVNTDEPEYEHFVQDYELTSRSVVLVDTLNGKQTDWKNLESIWDLVGDEDKFKNYIIEETSSFLKRGNE